MYSSIIKMVSKVTSFLFSVLVLGHLSDHKGRAWRRELAQMYCIETTTSAGKPGATLQLLGLFPSAQCHPPSEKTADSTLSSEYIAMCVFVHTYLCLSYLYKCDFIHSCFQL